MTKRLPRALCALILTVALAFAALPALGEFAGNALPSVGDSVAGFTVRELRPFPLADATLVYLTHDATGAQALYIACDDTDRAFNLIARAPAETEMGVSHVFEHSTLDGSAKYPSSELFSALTQQTYNTFMNAMTGSNLMMFPCSSLSEQQLMCYLDYYLEGIFHPLLAENEAIYRQEAWRYEMADQDAPLTVNGTVYSEMKGASSVWRTGYWGLRKTLFPGSNCGNDSGGVPSEIVKLVNADLVSYHDRYFRPSNMIAVLYGALDLEAFLTRLDETFSQYDGAEVEITDDGYAPLTESVVRVFDYPVEAGSSVENGSEIFYGFLCEGASAADANTLRVLASFLSHNSSPVVRRMKEALPTASVSCGVMTDTPVPVFYFTSAGLNETDAALFEKTVREGLAEISENGLSAEIVDALAASLRLNAKLMPESTGLGIGLSQSVASLWASTGDVWNYFDYLDTLDHLLEMYDAGTYDEALNAWLPGNSLTALVTAVPRPGLKEQNEAAQQEALAAVKAAMTEDEIAQIVRETAENDGIALKGDTADYLRQLTAVTVDSLPEEMRDYEVKETLLDGARCLSAQAPVEDVVLTSVSLDTSGFPQEDLPYLKLYMSLLGELPTDTSTVAELTTRMARYLYDGSIAMSAGLSYDGSYSPRVKASWTALTEDLQAGYELVSELLWRTQLTDAQAIAGYVSRSAASLKKNIIAAPYAVSLYRDLSVSNEGYAYLNSVSYLNYYEFLSQTADQMETDPQPVLDRLLAVQARLANRFGAIVTSAGDEAGIAQSEKMAAAFLAELENEPFEKASYSFEAPAQSEALIVDADVQYNMLFAPLDVLGLEESGALDALMSVVYDRYLFPMLRSTGGAYGCLTGASREGLYLISYRDPNVAATYDVYAQLGGLLASLEISQEELDGYIISAYSGYAMPEGALSGAASALSRVLTGTPDDLKLTYMRQLKALTPEALVAYAPAFDALAQKGLRSTSGGENAIRENEALFEVVLNPFGSEN